MDSGDGSALRELETAVAGLEPPSPHRFVDGAAAPPLEQRLTALQDGGTLAPEQADALAGLFARYHNLVADARVMDRAVVGPSFDSLRAEYDTLLAGCTIRPEHAGEVAWYVGRLHAYQARYVPVAAKLAMPWWFVGIVHALEASFNFNGHLHNGDPLSARTVHVPAGRPLVWNPPNDWESSAVDALTMMGYAGQPDWTPAHCLYRWEAYNGWGYRPLGVHSPYLWSYSGYYSAGKFGSDHKFEPGLVSKQCGAATMLKALAL